MPAEHMALLNITGVPSKSNAPKSCSPVGSRRHDRHRAQPELLAQPFPHGGSGRQAGDVGSLQAHLPRAGSRPAGNPEVIDLDSFKVPVTRRVSKTIRKRKTLMVTSGGRVQRITQDVDLADGGYIVETMPSHGYRRSRHNEFCRLTEGGSGISFSDIESVIMTCVEFGLIEVGTTILVKSPDQAAIGDNWTLLADDLIDELRDCVDVSEFTGLHKKTVNNMNHHVQEFAKMRGFSNAPADIREFYVDATELYRALESNSTASTSSDKAFSALKKLSVEINKPDVACPIAAIHARYEGLCSSYMLFRMIMEEHSWGYDARDMFCL